MLPRLVLLFTLFLSFNLAAQTYRPAIHFTPPQNWINDPNGLVYYNGKYHMFYQYNPFGDKWGHMSWGHATSKDLMKWNHLDVAIPEYKNPDGTTTMIFSGTAIPDRDNTSRFATSKGKAPLVCIYTAHVDSNGTGILQNQAIAYSNDGIKFTQYQGNPVLDIGLKDFRDPKVFWHEQSNRWIMIVAKPVHYSVQFYSSENLKQWQFLSEFSDSKADKSKIWECPDIFELPVENEKGIKKWVITLSGGHPQQDNFPGMQYFIGEFDGTAFRAQRLSYPLYLDYGKDFYAGIIFNALPAKDKRKIMIGWANNWEYADKIPTKGFRGQMSLPRELNLYRNDAGEYRLRSYPASEVNRYKGKTLFRSGAIVVNGTRVLDNVNSDLMNVEFTLRKGAATKAGIRLLKNDGGETLVYFDKNDNSIKLDRRNSGNVSFSERFPGIESVPIEGNNDEITFRIIVDKCIVEVYANKGKQVITDLVFPLPGTFTTELYTEDGAAQFRDILISAMKPSM